MSSVYATDSSISEYEEDSSEDEGGIPDFSLPLGYRLSHLTQPLERPHSLLQALHCPTPPPIKPPTIQQAFARYPGTKHRKPPPIFPLPIWWEDGWDPKTEDVLRSEEQDEDMEEDEGDLLRCRGERDFRLPFDIAHWFGLKKAQEEWDGKIEGKRGRLRMRRAAFPSKQSSRMGDINYITKEKTPRAMKGKGKEKIRPPKYKRIFKNIYYRRLPDKYPSHIELPICQCIPPPQSTPPSTPSSLTAVPLTHPSVEKRSTRGSDSTLKKRSPNASVGCGDKCLNRSMLYTCPSHAPCQTFCQNRPLHLLKGYRIKAHSEGETDGAGSEIFWTGNRGFGLRAKRKIPAGAFVMDYRGEIITMNECYRRVIEDYKDSKNFYFLQYTDFEVIDAGRKGNEARFMNHSCDPNTQVTKYKFGDVDEFQIGFFAIRDIESGEELTYDYGWQDFGKSDSTAAATAVGTFGQACLCGAGPEKCRGTLGGKKKVVEKEKKIRTSKRGRRRQKRPLPTPSQSNDGRDLSDVSSLTEISDSEELQDAIIGKRKARGSWDIADDAKKLKV